MARLRARPLKPKYFGIPNMMCTHGANGEDRTKHWRWGEKHDPSSLYSEPTLLLRPRIDKFGNPRCPEFSSAWGGPRYGEDVVCSGEDFGGGPSGTISLVERRNSDFAGHIYPPVHHGRNPWHTYAIAWRAERPMAWLLTTKGTCEYLSWFNFIKFRVRPNGDS